MEDFEIIEADFQQYYHLDVLSIGFRKYTRLLVNLPSESRFVTKYSPFRDWNWDREIQAQILHVLDIISVNYVNANRKKGAKKAKAPELAQPEYVKKAKKEAEAEKHHQISEAEKDDLKAFFEARNFEVNKLEEETSNGA